MSLKTLRTGASFRYRPVCDVFASLDYQIDAVPNTTLCLILARSLNLGGVLRTSFGLDSGMPRDEPVQALECCYTHQPSGSPACFCRRTYHAHTRSMSQPRASRPPFPSHESENKNASDQLKITSHLNTIGGPPAGGTPEARVDAQQGRGGVLGGLMRGLCMPACTIWPCASCVQIVIDHLPCVAGREATGHRLRSRDLFLADAFLL